MLALSTQRCAAAASAESAGGAGAAAAAAAVACGVSSFGFSGTIAHALLLREREPRTAHTGAPPRPPPARRARCRFLRRRFVWGEAAGAAGATGAGGGDAADCAGPRAARAAEASSPRLLPATPPPAAIRSPARSAARSAEAVRAELAALVGGLMVGGAAALGGEGGGSIPLEAHGPDSLELPT